MTKLVTLVGALALLLPAGCTSVQVQEAREHTQELAQAYVDVGLALSEVELAWESLQEAAEGGLAAEVAVAQAELSVAVAGLLDSFLAAAEELALAAEFLAELREDQTAESAVSRLEALVTSATPVRLGAR